MTQAAIDAVFADERYRSKFTSPQRDKAMIRQEIDKLLDELAE